MLADMSLGGCFVEPREKKRNGTDRRRKGIERLPAQFSASELIARRRVPM